jgi:radial spoke head protein 1
MIYVNEGEYFGRFENGKRHGEGVFSYKKTKDIYSGSWKFNKKHGNGTYIFESIKTKVINSFIKIFLFIYLNRLLVFGIMDR